VILDELVLSGPPTASPAAQPEPATD